MKLKITPEMEASIRETEHRLDKRMSDPSFRAEHEETMARYAALELVDNLRSAYVRKLSGFPTRRQITIRVSFGAGTPPSVKIPNRRELAFS